MDMGEFTMIEKSMTPKKASIFSYIITFTAAVLYTVIYLLRYDYGNIFVTMFKPTFLLEFFILMVFVFLFMAAGLLVKAAILASACENKWHGLKFKIVRGLEKPYCSALTPVKVSLYITALLAYIILTAVLPYIIAFFAGDFMFVFASFIGVLLSGGDILMLFKLIGKNSGEYILDIDCVIFYRVYYKT
ncbi:MAG: hypothetical protein FWH24_06070 [Oscillospiraceae bacterium]|nr:hypothetical protein [Oscillospiraceae bacterium]